ncbi:MAG: DUF349 domain-containing protein [Thiohalocapsa sp.]
MFLKRLFGRPSKTRGVPDLDQLIEAVLHSPDSAVRRDACHALTDLRTLRLVAQDDANAALRDLAGARYRKLLCGVDPKSPPLAERMTELTGVVGDQALLAQIAIQATDAELRQVAIEALESPEALADCALDDALAQNRLNAAERLRDKAALERVARGAAKRDKRVYRLVRQRLKEISAQEERPRLVKAQCEALCEKLERLGRFDNWVQDQALLGHLEQQWAELEAEADADVRARYGKLHQAFLDAYAAYASQHAAKIAAEQASLAGNARRQALAAELEELATLTDLDQLNRRLTECELAWEQIEPAADNATDRRYGEALAAAGEQRNRLDEAGRHARAARSLLADAKALLERGGELDRKRVKTLRQRLGQLESRGEGGGETLRDCVAALDKLQQRLDKHRDHVARKLAALPERLAQLDRHFEEGRLKKAEPLYQSITATLAQAHGAGLPLQDIEPVETHLKDLAPQIQELQRWRRWGTDNKREDLCVEIERLAGDAEHELEPLANRLRELRDAWRELDHNGAPADDALWRRFQTAAEPIHERCKPFLDARAKIRAASHQQREALCDQLETFLEQVDWERMDWKKAARAEREMRQAWTALGPLEGRHHKPLEGRFFKLLRRLDKALDVERQQNRRFKQDLIRRMEALIEESDLHRAIDTAKQLQQQWQTTVPGRQRDENALWKTFRAASDAVFARRAEQQQARGAEMREHQAARTTICEELENLVQQADDSEGLRTTLGALETRWRDTEGLPLPRQAVQGLQRRWSEAFDSARQRLHRLEQIDRWTAIERLNQRTDFCDRTARQLIAAPATNRPEPGQIDKMRQEWAALPAVDDPDLVRRLDEAFEQILDAEEDVDGRNRLLSRMSDNAERRLQLCLHLEMAAGADSPPELKQQRMELQVSRLREHMGDGSSDPLADAATLLRDWYLCAPSDEVDGLEARFDRVKQALIGAQTAPDAGLNREGNGTSQEARSFRLGLSRGEPAARSLR